MNEGSRKVTKFKKLYESKNENWKSEMGSREEMNAYLDYKRARDGGANHEEAIAQVEEMAEADAKFMEVMARLPEDSSMEWHRKHREGLEQSATARRRTK